LAHCPVELSPKSPPLLTFLNEVEFNTSPHFFDSFGIYVPFPRGQIGPPSRWGASFSPYIFFFPPREPRSAAPLAASCASPLCQFSFFPFLRNLCTDALGSDLISPHRWLFVLPPFLPTPQRLFFCNAVFPPPGHFSALL